MDKEIKRKQFYDKTTGVIDVKPFYDDYDEKDARPYIEMTINEWSDKLSTQNYFYNKVYKNGEIIDVLNPDLENEYNEFEKNIQLSRLKEFLSSTDYVITKLNEAKIEDETEFQKLRLEYADILIKRKETRVEINELEGI